MPNPIKYTTGSESLALKKGNFYIGTGDVGKGPSDTTGFYQGISPSAGGYVIYMNKSGAPGDLSYHNAVNDSELISFTNNLAGTSYTTVNECLVYYASQTDKVVLNRDYEGIVTDGLVLNLDAGFTPSYPRSGTTWSDISLSGNNGTLTNGPTFSTDGGGSIVFDGVDDYGTIGNPENFQVDNLTIDIWLTLSEPLDGSFNFKGIFSTVNSSSGYQLFYFGGSNTYFYFYRSTVAIKTEILTYESDTLLNIVCTYEYNNPSNCVIYINGENKSLGTPVPFSTSNSSLNATIGGPRADLFGGFYLSSKHHIVRFYNRALSATEVLQNYNATKGRFGL